MWLCLFSSLSTAEIEQAWGRQMLIKASNHSLSLWSTCLLPTVLIYRLSIFRSLSYILWTWASDRKTFAVKGEGTLFLPGTAWAGYEHRAAIVLRWEIVLKALKQRLHVGVHFLSRAFFPFLSLLRKKKERKWKREPCTLTSQPFLGMALWLVIVVFTSCCLGFPVFLWPGY